MVIIPLREKIGNYDVVLLIVFGGFNYTTTRENWELRLTSVTSFVTADYTTTRENWELRLANEEDQAIRELYHYERKLGTTTYC